MTTSPTTSPNLKLYDHMTPDEEDTWDMMDALYPGHKLTEGDGQVDIFAVLDGTAFGGQLSLQPIPKSEGSWEDVDIPHFPDLSIIEQNGESSKRGRTSEPLGGSSNGQEDSVMGLVSYERFQEFVETPIGLLRFSQWVEEEGQPGSSANMRCFQDATAYLKLVKEMQAITKGIDEVYFNPGRRQSISDTSPHQSVCASSLASTLLGMERTLQDVTRRLYETEFKRFLAGSITEHARSRLGMSTASSDRGNLGEVFCLADPRLPDQPLVYVSDQFCELTEYPRSRILGRNCRFLQGPSTDKAAVQLLRDAIIAGREHCSLILNYTRTGKPFWNLLHMIPLRGPNGTIEYFLGAQVNVTRALTSSDAFTALSGLSRRDWINQSEEETSISFSHRVMAAAETNLRRPLSLRGLGREPVSRPMLPTPSHSAEHLSPSMSESSTSGLRKPRKLFGFTIPKSVDDTMIPMESNPSTGGLEPFEQSQPVPQVLRDHMAAFSNTYSKMMILQPGSTRIAYVTPPLLHMLGHSVRTPSDRYLSALYGSDLLELLAGPTAEGPEIAQQSIRNVIDKQKTHSVFASFKTSHRERQPPRDVPAFVDVLLHLTPMKGVKGDVRYVVVVG